MGLDQALSELQDTLAHAQRGEAGHGRLRQRLGAVRDALAEEAPHFRDGWLSARDAATERDRRRLLARLRTLSGSVPGQGSSYGELRRLGVDLEHYRQRVHDLAYDAVGLELGGSE